MASLRLTQEVKHSIHYPRYVDRDDIQKNGLLLTDSQIKKALSILKTQTDKRFTKVELSELGLIHQYSIIKNENKYFVVYKKNNYLGQGGQGKVKIAQYIGSDIEDKNPNWTIGKLLALKVVAPKNPKNLLHVKAVKADLEKEQKFLEILGRAHTKIIERNKRGIPKYQFLQELMPGEDLFDYLNGPPQYRYLSTQDAIKILRNALAEMQFLHSKGILHCDIKLENAIYDVKTGKVSFVDMGIAMQMDEDGKARHEPVGTQEFMAPEIYQGLFNEATEIYALGWFFRMVLSHVRSVDKNEDFIRLATMTNNMVNKNPKVRPTASELNKLFETFSLSVSDEKKESLSKDLKEGKKEEVKEEKKSDEKAERAINWLNKLVRFELPQQYRLIEKGRQKHLKHIEHLVSEFHTLLGKSEEYTKESHLLALVHVLEKEFSRLQKRWCSPSLFSKMKRPDEFIAHLNKEINRHHYSRMLGIILKATYENHAALLGDNLPLKDWIKDLEINPKYQISHSFQKSSIKMLPS